MKFHLLIVLLLFPAISFAQKPDCETIKKIVEESRAKEAESLKSELDNLEMLRIGIRRGKAKLKGADGKKSGREQLQIVMAKIESTEKKIEAAKTSIPFPRFTIQDLKVGHFGYFGKGDDDFRVNEIIDSESFTAFIQYQTSILDSSKMFYRPVTRTTRNLYLVKGIKTKGMVDNKMAEWKGYLYCSGTQKLELISGDETVFVLEPLDVELCFKKEEKD